METQNPNIPLFLSAYLVFTFFFGGGGGTIYKFHCIVQLTFNFFFSTLSVKSFQFQLIKLFLKEPLIRRFCLFGRNQRI